MKPISVCSSIPSQTVGIALDTETQRLTAECYDQLASESRIATFVAIAKKDIPRRRWFPLVRRHRGSRRPCHIALLGGTMFEYLMPCLWMNTYPGYAPRSRLYRSCPGSTSRMPWMRRSMGNFRIGHPATKLDGGGSYSPSVCLSWRCAIHPAGCVGDLALFHPFRTTRQLKRDMANLRAWNDQAGSAPTECMRPPTTRAPMGERQRPEIVRSWMAHHQGMSLLAITNWLCDGVVRRWFHCNPSVQATELLLQERPASRVRIFTLIRPRLAA